MRRSIQIAIFFTFFFAVTSAMNWYAISTFYRIFSIERELGYFALVFITTLAFPLATFIEKRFPSPPSRWLYILSSLWIGAVFLSCCIILLYDLFTWFIPLPEPVGGMLMLNLLALLLLYSIINASRIEVKTLSVSLPNLKKDMRIVHISDIHMGTVRNGSYLTKIVRMIKPINPEAVMLTGDLVDGSAPLKPHMFDALEELVKLGIPIFYVTGNHEYYEGIDNIYALLEQTHLHVLKDEVELFKGIQIVGVQYAMEEEHLKKTLATLKIDRNKPSILLYHLPAEIPAAVEKGVSLMLSGHTHYGQIFPQTLLVRIAFKYLKGLYKIKDMFLYVSPGTGTWGPYMRLGSSNEITVIELKKH